jgi:adenine-specific DNA-methyltransferase
MGTNNNKTELTWPGKSADFERVSLPFQCIETIQNGKRITKTKDDSLELFESYEPHFSQNGNWQNLLIWGENKYVMSSLLKDFEGKIDLIYIDPPFATGADFSFKVKIGDFELTKEQSIIEEKAYRDTWGKGIESYLDMIYQRLILMKSLLKETGSIYVHLDWHVGHYVKMIMDEIFEKVNFVNEIVWFYPDTPGRSDTYFPRKHDVLLYYQKSDRRVFNSNDIRVEILAESQPRLEKSLKMYGGLR